MYTRKSQIHLSVVHDATPCANFATAHMAIIFIDCGNPQKFFREDLCDALTTKVFCLESFMVYGTFIVFFVHESPYQNYSSVLQSRFLLRFLAHEPPHCYAFLELIKFTLEYHAI